MDEPPMSNDSMMMDGSISAELLGFAVGILLLC